MESRYVCRQKIDGEMDSERAPSPPPWGGKTGRVGGGVISGHVYCTEITEPMTEAIKIEIH